MWGNKKGASKRIDSLVGHSTKITGNMDFSGGLLIDGKVIGNITAVDDDNATITISENGYVQGEIQIPNIVINGTVEGNVYASNNVELAKKARVYGNVYYNLFEMAMGAEVNGNLVHVSQDKITAAIEPKAEQAQLEEPEVLTQ
ncbi:MAG: polymer-forming cytoskeletal protein [gamma proteobacterium symbiont of Bathyaustriella thionipta]|nr:polymer-forming cytoskeletal protein [gamma proteobacterium symbiont of Bathyaustriella thionipta]MCU7950415.1 polymer-forming cytoskeletal protein [gamma proteobacterium symbiont of Bathyaustriella thionipta]MCU7953350.1 polymer-forming cytoskeletal protein [gamma proteobacterium symbiont of Bathyaustriella thionipta]MCU7956910.1 polymer-forming cytoskeletal protein [gamma proteobacterium symbiont of Bathyaustriella thionipta]MCU7968138.1 polymer-forming cytoskeletal protein [gamma proteoba